MWYIAVAHVAIALAFGFIAFTTSFCYSRFRFYRKRFADTKEMAESYAKLYHKSLNDASLWRMMYEKELADKDLMRQCLKEYRAQYIISEYELCHYKGTPFQTAILDKTKERVIHEVGHGVSSLVEVTAEPRADGVPGDVVVQGSLFVLDVKQYKALGGH